MWASIGWGGLSYFGGLMLDRLGFGASYVTYGLMSMPCLVAIARLKYGSGAGAQDSRQQAPSPQLTKVRMVPHVLPPGHGLASCDCMRFFCTGTASIQVAILHACVCPQRTCLSWFTVLTNSPGPA